MTPVIFKPPEDFDPPPSTAQYLKGQKRRNRQIALMRLLIMAIVFGGPFILIWITR